jgi:hypothetical protein
MRYANVIWVCCALSMFSASGCKKNEPNVEPPTAPTPTPTAEPKHGPKIEMKVMPKDAEPCPLSYDSVDTDKRAVGIECSCTGPTTGTVWGNAIYTTDSAICSAAIHAGAIPATGGKVVVHPAPGCSRYKGASAHGITTESWTQHDGSFYFVGFGNGTCPPTLTNPCPRTYGEIPGDKTSADFTCNCEGDESGNVFGTDIYTLDSSICRAAVHAGAITSAGGSVTVRSAAGCPKYSGKAQNGVTSSDWASYPSSFFFPSKGTGKCQ